MNPNQGGAIEITVTEHVKKNLMKLGGSLGNVPKKLKKLVLKTQYILDF
jgi:hypothetical protein